MQESSAKRVVGVSRCDDVVYTATSPSSLRPLSWRAAEQTFTAEQRGEWRAHHPELIPDRVLETDHRPRVDDHLLSWFQLLSDDRAVARDARYPAPGELLHEHRVLVRKEKTQTHLPLHQRRRRADLNGSFRAQVRIARAKELVPELIHVEHDDLITLASARERDVPVAPVLPDVLKVVKEEGLAREQTRATG
eukprot:30497-Pelagococcus_subviridis.AAC.27